MLLNEVFDQPVKWRIESDTDEYTRILFDIDKSHYEFTATLEDDDGLYEIMFGLYQYKFMEFPKHARYDIWNVGNQHQVFATVIDIMKYFMRTKQPSQLTFMAVEPSRRKLYLHMIKKLLPSWDIKLDAYQIILTNPNKELA